jgi:hypothetical protein
VFLGFGWNTTVFERRSETLPIWRVLDGITFTVTTLPILRSDALLSTGSLYLFDLGHSLGGVSGVPASGAVIPNIAYAEAAAVLGAGTESSLAGVFSRNAVAADALFERTPKKGLYTIYSQVNNAVSGHGSQINVAAAIRDYIIANKTHLFYFSVWAHRTRAAIATGHRYMEIDSGGNFLGDMSGAGNTGKASGIYNVVGGANAVANRYSSMRASTGSGDTVAAAAASIIFGNGGSGSALTNQCPSDISYRGYCEDLTVSGRTYADVDALDKALWDAAFAAGGRFAGDTFTAPSTFP